VVTLARSVAHLSSEMRTQHIMLQEIENIREEVAQLRVTQPSVRAHSAPRITSLKNYEPSNHLGTNNKIKKLTKFFGDEPPLLRLFLRKLGYEVRAIAKTENQEIINFSNCRNTLVILRLRKWV
jgi:hypothetical protein